MSAGIYNFIIEQGTTFRKRFTWKDSAGNPIDLTGYTAKMQARDGQCGDLVLDFSVAPNSITIGGIAGTVDVLVPDNITTSLNFDTADWDIKLTKTGDATRLLKGVITLDKQVSQ